MHRINRRKIMVEDSDEEENALLFECNPLYNDTCESNDTLACIWIFVKRLSYVSLNCFIKYLNIALKASGIYLVWISLHYGASHLYVKWCVPNTFYGYLISPFMTPTPHCQGLRWIIYRGAEMINNMWFLLGTWIASSLLFISQNEQGEKK